MKKILKVIIGVLSHLLCTLCFLFLISPVGAQNYQKEHKLESSYLALTVDFNGKVSSLYDKEQKLQVPFKAVTSFKNCLAEVLSVTKENETIIIKKKVIGENGQTLLTTEIFSFENDLLKWELEILPAGDMPWSTNVQTVWSLAGSDVKYWTTWGDPRPETSENNLSKTAMDKLLNGEVVTASAKLPKSDWADPLVTQPLFPRKLYYGASIYGNTETNAIFDKNIRFNPGSRRNYFSVPIVGLFDAQKKYGVSLGFSPENIGIEALLEVTNDNRLIFSRYNNRFTPGKKIKFTTFIKLHEANWRAALQWYVKKFSSWFDPVNPKVQEFGGTSSYSYETKAFDADKMKRMAYKTNWDATFQFPYMGLFLPEVGENEGWLSWRGEYMTYKKIDDYYKSMQGKGFHVLSYFNVTEFGSNILKEAYNPREPERKPWINANTYLNKKLEPAVLYYPQDTTFSKYIYSWDRCVVMDAGEPVYADHLLEQINRHIEKLPHFEGIAIDRLDWTRHYNTRRDDGVSWFNGAPARSLHISWDSIVYKIAGIMHKNNKVIFINDHVKRLSDVKYIDGVFDEFGDIAASINANAFLCVNKPLLGWCHNKASIGEDFDAFMQKDLHLGMYPMAPFPANDHALLPDDEVDQLYLDYGELFKVMKGKNWVLEPGVVEVVGNKAKVNIFKTDSGIIIPITFGKEDVVTLKVKNITKSNKIEIIHPGEREWKEVKMRKGTLKIPLNRGCAMIRIN